MPAENPKSPKTPGTGLFGWLGRQVGHVKKAIQADVEGKQPRTIYRDKHVEEQPLPSDPKVKLRRTVIDEVIVDPQKEPQKPAKD
ncbi:MAG: hypothetical protein ABSF29_11330 [Tepidisphaeraceae bacterium]|jgi:hypothetical protein